MIEKSEPTFWAEIAIAGDANAARQACRQFAMKGLCVTVTETTFIYTGGAEAGVLVRLINYPRFPAMPDETMRTAEELGDFLREALYQHSYSIVTPSHTVWRSWREA